MAPLENVWVLHGIFGATAIFVVLPLGAVKFRISLLPSWISHWVVQTVGYMLILIAAGVGLLQSSSIHSDHQIAGLCLVTMLLVQAFLGHCLGGSAKQALVRSWSIATHCIQGFSCLFLGWWTVVTGLLLASFNSTTIILVSLVTLTELVSITFVCVVKRYRTAEPISPNPVVSDESDEEMAMYSSDDGTRI